VSDPERDAEELFEKFPDLRGQLEAMLTKPALVPIAPLELRPTIVTRVALLPVFGIPAALAVATASPLTTLALVAGYALSWTVITRRRAIVDDAGVELRGTFGRRRMAWDQIAHYTYWATLASARWTEAGRLGDNRVVDSPRADVSRVHHRLRLHDAAGRTLQLDSFFRGTERAVRRILDELHRRLATRADDFAPYAITDDGLTHDRHGVLAWADLEKVVLDGSEPPDVRVMKDGKILPWSRTSLGKIHNGMRFLERLAERGVVLDPGHRAFVTRPLLDALVRADRLPRAALVRRR
jgi:hypothetical protein